MFVPRSVKARPPAPKPPPSTHKSARFKEKEDAGNVKRQPAGSPDGEKDLENDEEPTQAADEKEVQRKRELATFVELSLTDYALWCTPELRQTVETQSEGWISFETLIRHAPLLHHVEASANDLAQALRVHGHGRLEMRLSLTKRSTRSGVMFDIRRKDWEDLRGRNLRDMSEEEWNAQTIYVENIPPQHYKTKYNLVTFLETCIGSPSAPFVVQDISFPPKEGRDENDTKCRGFAFVICNTAYVAKCATEAWSWKGVQARFQETSGGGGSMEVEGEEVGPTESRDKIRLAKQCGFRAITYQRWCELRDEYLAYRNTLIAKLNARPEPDTTATSSSRISSTNTKINTVDDGAKPRLPDEPKSVATKNPASTRRVDHPKGCLVFVRNVHPGTNKTTLKTLLNLAFSKKRHDGSEIDYVDWSKGLDSCYVRASNPIHASRMVYYFDKYVQCQVEPSDDKLTRFVTPDMFKNRIRAELVEGEREDIYWRNVPDKIKQAALAKIRNTEVDLPRTEEESTEEEEEEERPPRKRRKKTRM